MFHILCFLSPLSANLDFCDHQPSLLMFLSTSLIAVCTTDMKFFSVSPSESHNVRVGERVCRSPS